jgi:hypothetical protein
VFKTEILPKGPNVRFVVTSRTADEPLALYEWYVDRGEAEGWVKDLKTPGAPTAFAAIASGPISSACSCTRPPSGCWRLCAAGWLAPAGRHGSNYWTLCALSC